MDIQEFIREQVNAHPVVLFMKGTPQFPQCGFSSTVIQILKQSGLTKVAAFNVLESEDLRQGIKQYANWPTIPQLYIKGEFVGGCDIVKELYETGELQQMLAAADPDAGQPQA
jgi:monothiol glutaredoxin